MSRSPKPRTPGATCDEVVPRNTRPDPRADPDEVTTPRTSQPPKHVSGPVPVLRGTRPSDIERLAVASREAVMLAERVKQLEGLVADRGRMEATLRNTASLQAERIAVLEREARASALRVVELENQIASRGADQELDRLLEATASEPSRLRSQAEEIEALRLAVECARAENAVLRERLAEERARERS